MSDEFVVICMRITAPLILPDNQTGNCRACGWRVQFRPDAPSGPRLCFECAKDLIDPDVDEVVMPADMFDDVREFFRKQKQ